MSVEDILFEPIQSWRSLCERIKTWIEAHYDDDPTKQIYRLDRERPDGALTLIEFVEVYHEQSRQWFWRYDSHKNPPISAFRFNGSLHEPHGNIPYPYYEEVDYSFPRSIEDANLVPNTYTRTFIFRTEVEAKAAKEFLAEG